MCMRSVCMCFTAHMLHLRQCVQPAHPVVEDEALSGPTGPDEVRVRWTAREFGVLLTAAKVSAASDSYCRLQKWKMSPDMIMTGVHSWPS